MHKEIQNYLSHVIPLLEIRGLHVVEQKEISYGIQLKLKRQTDKASINIYFSEKRGISTVIGGSKDSLLNQELKMLLLGEATPQKDPAMHFWHAWIGSDECGKGDYFGPLVISAFFLRREQEDEIRELGVSDSKRLRDPQIEQIARKLYLQYPGQCNCMIIGTRRYNELIADFKAQGRNLNDLLAWGHESVISGLLKKTEICEGILVDQFSKAQKVKARLGPKHPQLKITERTGAERDAAVAAASILARYQFLLYRRDMDKRYKMKFPLGANPVVIKAANEFIKRYGRQNLDDVAKLHFKTTDQLALHKAETEKVLDR